jgi:hypothetical protein
MTRLQPLWEQQGNYAASSDRRVFGTLWPNGGVIGMTPAWSGGGMVMNLSAGTAVVPDPNFNGAAYLCTSDAQEQVTLSAAPPSGSDRFDIIAVQPRDAAQSGANNDWLFNVIQGSPASSPVAPTVPPGQLPICQIRVTGGSATIAPGLVTDLRGAGLATGGPPASPVTTGSTIQSFTDALGEVWVAKNGVNGGLWKKARDVLYSRVQLGGTPVIGTTYTTLPWDAAVDDFYGLATLGANAHFTAPVAGLYLFVGKWVSSMTAGNQYAGGSIRRNATPITPFPPTFVVPLQINIHVPWTMEVRCNAGDSVDYQAVTSTAGLTTTAGANHNWATWHYLGTG